MYFFALSINWLAALGTLQHLIARKLSDKPDIRELYT